MLREMPSPKVYMGNSISSSSIKKILGSDYDEEEFPTGYQDLFVQRELIEGEMRGVKDLDFGTLFCMSGGRIFSEVYGDTPTNPNGHQMFYSFGSFHKDSLDTARTRSYSWSILQDLQEKALADDDEELADSLGVKKDKYMDTWLKES